MHVADYIYITSLLFILDADTKRGLKAIGKHGIGLKNREFPMEEARYNVICR